MKKALVLLAWYFAVAGGTIGPFDNEGKRGFDTRFGPEEEAALAPRVDWRALGMDREALTLAKSADGVRADVCLDPPCFARKTQAGNKLTLAAAKASGRCCECWPRRLQ